MAKQQVKDLDDAQICEAVAQALTAQGLPATSEYTGGGISCVWVPDDPATLDKGRGDSAGWLWGMASDDWGASHEECFGEYDGQDRETDVPSDSQDIAAIAAGILAAHAKGGAL